MSDIYMLDIEDWRIIKILDLTGDPNLRQLRTAKLIYERQITVDYPVNMQNSNIIFPQPDQFDQAILRACSKYKISASSYHLCTNKDLDRYQNILSNSYIPAQFSIYPSLIQAKGKYAQGTNFPNFSETIKLFTPFSNTEALQSFVDYYNADDFSFIKEFNENVKMHIV